MSWCRPTSITFSIDDEIEKLLQNKLIRRCDYGEGEISSPIFLKNKTDSSFRLIFNLKSLNKNTEKQYFKMETITSILTLVIPIMYFTKIDLKDAYYTIPIFEDNKKYLKFANKDYLYKFTCLPNGCHGQGKLTKALKPSLSKIRLNKIAIVAYIDECLNMDKRERACSKNTKIIFNTFQNLGFTVYPEPKFSFYPTQQIEFLRFEINPVSMAITLTNAKKENLKLFCTNILNSRTPKSKNSCKLFRENNKHFPGRKI